MKTAPRPWTFRPPGVLCSTDCGAFIDANGNTICHFGDDEQYYPSNGEPPEKNDVALILAAVNAVGNDLY